MGAVAIVPDHLNKGTVNHGHIVLLSPASFALGQNKRVPGQSSRSSITILSPKSKIFAV